MIDNILHYPESCIYGKPVPKTTFYKFLEVSPAMRRHFQDDVVSIIWLYKIAEETMQVRKTETVKEIEIFVAELKNQNCDTNLFAFIDKNINKHIVFILKYAEQYRLLVNYKEWADTTRTRFNIMQTFLSDWFTTAQLSLPILGNELPAIYEGFVKHIAGKRLKENEGTLKSAVLAFQEQEALRKQLADLRQQLRKETQPHRKFALHQQVIAIQEKLK